MSFKIPTLISAFYPVIFLCSISIGITASDTVETDHTVKTTLRTAEEKNLLNCSIDHPMVVDYQIQVETKSGTKNKSLQLWRNKNRVAIHYPETEITELWERTKNNTLHLVRFFESHQRGIEYQPDEIKGSHDWSAKQQLISDSIIATMQLDTTTGNGCDLTKIYSSKTPKGSSQLEWLANAGLIKSYTEITARYRSTSTLQSINKGSNKVREKFELLSEYQTTDYTDIGDNESDPFLMGMMNLGFIEHGSTGSYDSNGHSMDSH